jgi:saccharopine dehydrogenase-like NADP-dependent oxidoreductase
LAQYPQAAGRRERITATLVAYGDNGGFTAMAKTVGLPAGIATKLILDDELPLTGCHIPTHPALYKPILAELDKAGLQMTEMVEAVAADS